MDSPSGRVPERAPERFLVTTEACGSGTPDLLCSLMFLGYMEIYRRKKYVRGGTRGPKGGGRAPFSCRYLMDALDVRPMTKFL